MELSHQLAEQLILLERQAAQVAALLDGAPPELLEAIDAQVQVERLRVLLA